MLANCSPPSFQCEQRKPSQAELAKEMLKLPLRIQDSHSSAPLKDTAQNQWCISHIGRHCLSNVIFTSIRKENYNKIQNPSQYPNPCCSKKINILLQTFVQLTKEISRLLKLWWLLFLRQIKIGRISFSYLKAILRCPKQLICCCLQDFSSGIHHQFQSKTVTF